jgi:diguanylate cyclase (GGDEF)-like protein
MLLKHLQRWAQSEPVAKYNVIGQGSLPGVLEYNANIRFSEEEKSTLNWIWEKFRQARYLSIAHDDKWAKISPQGATVTESDLRSLIQSQENLTQRIDELTGLNGKGGFNLRLRALASEANAAHPLSLIFFDLDGFKKLNDTLGHEAGDKALAYTAAAIRIAMSGAGEAFRWGGDEFVVLLPNHNLDRSSDVGEKIREEVERMFLDGKHADITTSIGIASIPETTSKVDDLVGLADRAMYSSKKNGKNRITRSNPDLS